MAGNMGIGIGIGAMVGSASGVALSPRGGRGVDGGGHRRGPMRHGIRGESGLLRHPLVSDDEDDDSGEEDEEDSGRVVFYDLDGGGRSQRLTAPAAPPNLKKGGTSGDRARRRHRLARPLSSQSLFASNLAKPTTETAAAPMDMAPIDEDEDEDEEEEEGGEEEANPFASLLRVAPTPSDHTSSALLGVRDRTAKTRPHSPDTHDTSTREHPSPTHVSVRGPNSSRTRMRDVADIPRATGRRLSLSSVSSQPPLVVNSKRATGPRIEAADARPARWATPGGSAAAAKRRRSLAASSAASRPQDAAKRRKSLPATTFSSLDAPTTATPGRRLSDVLQRATLLSSQRATDRSGFSSSDLQVHEIESAATMVERDDAIADHAHELQDEPFQPQFFSPSKPERSKRNSKPETVLAKIRGKLGDAIRAATRKTNRDLTLLRSHGQTLLRQPGNDGADAIYKRDYIVVRLERQRAYHSHLVTFDGTVHELRSTHAPNQRQVDVHSTIVVIMSSHSPSHQGLSVGKLLKVYSPFQVVEESVIPGQKQRRRFLLGTNLFDIVDANISK